MGCDFERADRVGAGSKSSAGRLGGCLDSARFSKEIRWNVILFLYSFWPKTEEVSRLSLHVDIVSSLGATVELLLLS